jgi:ribonuclease-3
LTDEHRQPEARDLASLEQALGYEFRDRTLLEAAVTHSSYANENRGASDNERLEFLGDSVIGMVGAGLLYLAHPEWREGDLTRGLHQLVDRSGLADLARRLDLGAHLQLGATELRSDGRDKDTILADAMEAVLGALYLDGGLGPVEAFAARVFDKALKVGAPRVELDPKTRFQEWVMTRFGVFPTYRVVDDSGVEGDEERFTTELVISEHAVARGSGRSKRRAEREAAVVADTRRDEIESEVDADA